MDTHTYGDGARGSTLWGKGPNGGSRDSTTWGRRGGSSVVAAIVAGLALLVPVSGAAADSGKTAPGTYVDPALLAKANRIPGLKLHVIVQSTGGRSAAENAVKGLGSLRKRLDLVGGVALDLPAGRINALAKVPGLTITSDALVKVSGSAAYNSAPPGHFVSNPLDKAVEKLWFSGIFVAVASGNYGVAGQPVHMGYAPGNDPFVMTVGALDLGGTVGLGNDNAAPFSAYGYTYDGFLKPDIAAPGRFIVGPAPAASTLVAQKPLNVTAPGYIQLSGTSFASPAVAGAAQEILPRHPRWTPARVKGALP